MTKTCVSCQSAIAIEAVFCNICGHPQPEKASTPTSAEQSVVNTPSSTCPKCGAVQKSLGRFCTACAFDLQSSPSATATFIACPRCGTQCGQQDRFCKNCATEVRASQVGLGFQETPIQYTQGQFVGGTSQPSPTPFDASPNSQRNGGATPPTQGVSLGPHWMSPSAGFFVLICFFLPWLELSCMGRSQTISGADLAQGDAGFYLFPLAAVVIIGTYFFFFSQKTLYKAPPIIISSSILGLMLLAYKAYSMFSSTSAFGRSISASDLGFKPDIGGFGTMLGFVIAMIGCAFMPRRLDNPDPWRDSAGYLKDEKAAMLIYAFRGVLAIPMTVVTPIFFLLKAPYRDRPLVRFHAFQSLLLEGVVICVAIVTLPLGPSFIELFLFLGLGYIIAVIVLAAKANRGEFFQVPIIGKWAMNLAQRPRGGIRRTRH